MKILEKDNRLNEKIVQGVNVLADYVSATLGPKGNTVILQPKDKRPILTKDGVTVASFLNLEDPFENAGAEIVKQAASRTNVEAGDGTTTSIVLSRAMLNESQKFIAAGHSPNEIKKGLELGCAAITTSFKENAKPIESIEDIEHIATISANNDPVIGKLIAKAIDLVGKNGSITLEDSKSFNTVLEFVDGFAFDSGYLAQTFVNNERKSTVEFQNSNVLLTDRKLTTVEEMMPFLDIAARDNKPLIIIADDIEGQALAALITNAMRGTMKVVGIKAPRYGEEKRGILRDISVATGAFLFSRESGVEFSDCKLSHFGQVKRVEIGKKYSILVGGSGQQAQIQDRIDQLKEEIAEENDLDICTILQERMTRLSSSVAIIKIGASSEVELVEKRHRIEDALEAVKAAQSDGIHPGGGVAFLRAYKNVKAPKNLSSTESIGFNIVRESLKSPVRQMAVNAGLSPELVLDRISKLKGNIGVNFLNNKTCNMIEEGIVDPVKVSISALRNAVSVISVLITANHAIIEK